MLSFLKTKLENKIVWKAGSISPDLLFETPDWHFVKSRKIDIKHDSLTSDHMDEFRDTLNRYSSLHLIFSVHNCPAVLKL